MQKHPITKYRPFPTIDLKDRQWPDRRIEKAPIWCSVDLRDGNQALAIPMSVAEKLEMFSLLVNIGFKQIEVGFPSASQIEFDFTRRLIEENRIPDDVSIQVLTQCREHLIDRTIEAVQGAPNVILHVYNSTSEQQRRITFGMSREEIKAIAVSGIQMVKDRLHRLQGSNVILEYSPESFSYTELDFSLEVCEAVMDTWGLATPQNPIILNLPNTVEFCTPNLHADQIEWMSRHLTRRDSVIISLHTHNDRGTGVAATELGLMAGAERVEGTLFGNGERTGNLDIVTVAMNMYIQGVDPQLDFSNLPQIREVYERTTRMEVHPRHPYGGDLVFTAFSGSHQDAIRKGMEKMPKAGDAPWDVPYLTIDPKDIGRTYEAIIRINSQSGKGGVAFILEQEYGLQLPKSMHPEFGAIINRLADKTGRELTSQEIRDAFDREYLQEQGPLQLEEFENSRVGKDHPDTRCNAQIIYEGKPLSIEGIGNGPIAAFCDALEKAGIKDFHLEHFSQHALGNSSRSSSVSYIQIRSPKGKSWFGAAIDTSIEISSLKALISAFNRSRRNP
jgi:2-isopropylmalate synthase